ncbi:unnamed protein product [Clonostachys rosea f. rosea IK726]|uniref:Uncharacterized protein n=1 Tax=Clonostachys rosea f. rosea IK726 TaxID=1349383 RepID=A0ACA9U642_BIOOC|nr:unnamed protein product [Clonostachys rosea f. rosea IK726]
MYHAPTDARRWQRQLIPSSIHTLLALKVIIEVRHFATNVPSAPSIPMRTSMADHNALTTGIQLPFQPKPHVRLIDADPPNASRLMTNTVLLC